MMFVDESGDPGYPGDDNWAKWGGSTHFARVGVIIHGWRWRTWNRIVTDFKIAEMLSWDAEIKASDIRHGKGVFMGWEPTQRESFRNRLVSLVGRSQDITMIGVVIDKRDVNTAKADRLVKPQVRSLELLLERYNQFLEQQSDKSGIVILDPVNTGSDDNLRYFQSFLLNKSYRLKPSYIVEGTFFVKSHTSNMMQIADICTNVFYRAMVRGTDTSDFSIIKPRFWRHNRRLQEFGIKHWP